MLNRPSWFLGEPHGRIDADSLAQNKSVDEPLGGVGGLFGRRDHAFFARPRPFGGVLGPVFAGPALWLGKEGVAMDARDSGKASGICASRRA